MAQVLEGWALEREIFEGWGRSCILHGDEEAETHEFRIHVIRLGLFEHILCLTKM